MEFYEQILRKTDCSRKCAIPKDMFKDFLYAGLNETHKRLSESSCHINVPAISFDNHTSYEFEMVISVRENKTDRIFQGGWVTYAKEAKLVEDNRVRFGWSKDAYQLTVMIVPVNLNPANNQPQALLCGSSSNNSNLESNLDVNVLLSTLSNLSDILKCYCSNNPPSSNHISANIKDVIAKLDMSLQLLAGEMPVQMPIKRIRQEIFQELPDLNEEYTESSSIRDGTKGKEVFQVAADVDETAEEPCNPDSETSNLAKSIG
ncbi:hypothetical protein RND81_10G063600 [Saponaria officinalis]|uniref:Uncharacterized protein n=1 Tax=Saponaria officinalis TaxID=3572 RepID=A0AAW1HYB3_SAPOF